MKRLLPTIAERLMRCPAAPYHEDLVAAEVIRICEEQRLFCESDKFGNLLVRCAARTIANPIALAAHMDHPGFVIRKRISETRFAARFLGGVGDRYFCVGTRLLLMPGRIRAQLGRRLSKRHREFEIETHSEMSGKVNYAVWDLPEFSSRNGILRGRVCDDLIGVATVLTVLAELRGTQAGANVIGVLTRAEEVGFQGALMVAKSKRLNRGSLVISLETSRELPPVKMGKGVILRVGDKASIFDSAATRFLAEVGCELKKRDRNFDFQRALMSGGTCEATAYQEYGYCSAAVCVALGNYHNCAVGEKIGAEYVSSSDAISMAKLLVESARQWKKFAQFTGRLPKRLENLAREGKRELTKRKLKIDARPGQRAKPKTSD